MKLLKYIANDQVLLWKGSFSSFTASITKVDIIQKHACFSTLNTCTLSFIFYLTAWSCPWMKFLVDLYILPDVAP